MRGTGVSSATITSRRVALTSAEEFAAFWEREFPRLVGALGLHCGDRLVAEELAQEALARVWRDWAAVRDKVSPGAWAQRIGFNLANSYYRRRQAERRATARLGARPDRVDDADVGDQVAVRNALAEMPAAPRAVLVLRFYLVFSVAETAEALAMPQGTVMTHTSRGIERLRQVFGHSLTIDEGASRP